MAEKLIADSQWSNLGGEARFTEENLVADGGGPGRRQAEEGPEIQDSQRGLQGDVALSLTIRLLTTESQT